MDFELARCAILSIIFESLSTQGHQRVPTHLLSFPVVGPEAFLKHYS